MKRSHRTHAVNPHRRAALGTTAAGAALSEMARYAAVVKSSGAKVD